MKIIVEGKVPEPEAIKNVTDPVCGALNLKQDTILVGPKGELANFVVYYDEEKSESKTRIPESLKKSPDNMPVLDNKNCMFEPKVLVARPGQTIRIKNSDTTGHNANLGFMNNKSANPLIPAGEHKDIVLDPKLEEPTAIPVACNVHPWMKGFVMVKAHPFVAVSDKDGQIEIKDLPAGKGTTLRVWHEALKSADSLLINGKPQKLSRNRMEIELKPGMNDLGEVKLDAKLLKP